jgi:hypothetical protein
MPPRLRPARSLLPALAACLTLGVAGCGTDDIQFNGGLFDMVGLSDNTKGKSGEAKLAERAPLVVPPTLDRLPPPGEAAAPPGQLADIKDPDAQKAISHAELEAKQAEYCKVNYEDAKIRGDEGATLAEGPLGPCRPSVLTSIKKWNKGDEAEGQ